MATGLENLKIYQMARNLEQRVHSETKKFPQEEKYRSVDQLNRSSSAVPNNIAEAYHKDSIKQKVHVLRNIAISEAEETRSGLASCAEKGFIKSHTASELRKDYTSLIKATYGYIRFLKTKE